MQESPFSATLQDSGILRNDSFFLNIKRKIMKKYILILIFSMLSITSMKAEDAFKNGDLYDVQSYRQDTTGFIMNQPVITNSPVSFSEMELPVLGFDFGYPSSINITGGYYFKDTKLMISGGFFGKNWYGFQGEYGWKLNSGLSFRHDINVIIGTFETKTSETGLSGNSLDVVRKTTFAGIAYSVNYSGFYLQTGFGYGVGDFGNPIFIFKMGYLFNLK